MFKTNKVLGGVLLIAGTCIGAGMLALPIISSPSGFSHSVLLLSVCWLFMYLSGLLVLEVNLSLENEPSYISMAHATLGRLGGGITWIFFLLLLYSLLAAYISGGGDLLQEAMSTLFNVHLHEWLAPILWGLLFAIVVYFGVAVTDYINRVFMFLLVFVYTFLVAISFPHIKFELLLNGHGKYLFAALPVIFTTLAFHIIIPTLRSYLEGDLIKLKRTLLLGSLLPFVVYVIWEFIIFGIIPKTGPMGLVSIVGSEHAVTQLALSLNNVLKSAWLSNGFRFFMFFAIASSFIGVSYGLFDFLADGLQIKKTHKGRLMITALTFLPPLMFAICYPKGFILALSYAGIFVGIVHGILPPLMAWRGRYQKKITKGYRLMGGKPLLLLIILFFLVVIFCDVAADLHWIPAIA